MIKREFQIGFKSFIICMLILVLMFLSVYLMYPWMMTEETIQSIDEMMEIFPPDVLKAFNMDMSSISTAYGWVKSEGFMYVLLTIGIYASILGGSCLLKEENEKTIEYLGSLPIKRSTILANKVLVGFLYLFLMVLIFGIFNYIALLLSCEFDVKQFVLLSITPILIAFPFYSIHLFLSTFLHQNQKLFGFSLGFVIVSYFFSVFSELSENVEALKYFSIYTLADTRNVISEITINPWMILVSAILTIIFLIFSFIHYQKKEFF